MVQEHAAEHPSQWAVVEALAPKLACATESCRRRVRPAEQDTGQRGGLTAEERRRLKDLDREHHDLNRANEILRDAAALFAQAALDRRSKS
jgi:transposase-like protein